MEQIDNIEVNVIQRIGKLCHGQELYKGILEEKQYLF